MNKTLSFSLIILAFIINFTSKLAFANANNRYQLIGTIISSNKNKSLAIIKDTKTSETKVLRAGTKLDSGRSISIRSIEQDKVTLTENIPQKNSRTIHLFRRQSSDPSEIAKERENNRLEKMKDVIENLNDLKELRAYFKKKEEELKNEARR